LEGNFAFAAGVQEMLLQSHGGVIRVFPAIPADWDECDFSHLRAEGAFLVSAQRSATGPDFVGITAEKGGFLHIELPAGDWTLVGRKETAVNGIWQLNTKKGERLVFLPKVTSRH
jgi:alpha-L-fucosidase 2